MDFKCGCWFFKIDSLHFIPFLWFTDFSPVKCFSTGMLNAAWTMFDLCMRVWGWKHGTEYEATGKCLRTFFFLYFLCFFITLRSYLSFSARCFCALRFPCLRAVIVEFAFDNKLTFFELLLNTVRINRPREPERNVPRALCVVVHLIVFSSVKKRNNNMLHTEKDLLLQGDSL